MNYEFYIDVFWLNNFLMDAAAALLVMVIRRYKLKFRIFAAIAVTDTISCLAILALPYAAAVAVIHILLNPLMVWWGFSIRSWKRLLQDVLLVFVMIFLEGGVWQWCSENEFLNKFRYPAICIYALLLVFLWSLRRTESKKRKEYVVDLYMKNTDRIELHAFYDSGNLLRDPYTNSPVSIVCDADVEEYIKTAGLPVRLIPFHSLGKSEGLLKAVTIDKMVIHTKDRKIQIQKPVIGINSERLFAGKKYHMLLHAASLEGEEACT
ncbi:MAG: sigma-E processing peptidase SpoIIGA [Eubacterium sp.]|nr:sigma-E processing peptidase SpoIIGA [Eubacterium sp.]